MASALSSPAFMGKYRLRSTSPTGESLWVAGSQVSGFWVVAANATSPGDDALWSAYDAGSGAVCLQAQGGLFVAVNNTVGAVVLASSASAAQPLLFSTLPTTATSPATVTCTRASPSAGQLYYTVGTLPYLMFSLSGHAPPSGVLTTLQMSLVTPSLAAIQAAGSAAGCDLRGVDLSSASLAGVNCTSTLFNKATLRRTCVSGAVLTDAQFPDTDVRGLIWGDNIQAQGANFAGSIGCAAVVTSTGTPPHGPQANFSGCSFAGADWAGADLANASLASAIMFDANFSGAVLDGANLSGVSAGLSSSGDWQPADFSGASLIDADFNGAHLEGVTFSGAQMYFQAQGGLDNAYLVQTDFTNADLTEVPFNKTVVQGACFDRAILVGCTFTAVAFGPSSDGSPVSMIGAHLEGARFASSTMLTGVRLSQAWVAASAGIPLLTTAPASGWIRALDDAQVPSGLATALGSAGYRLSGSATVEVVKAGSSWSLSQSPIETTVNAVEPTTFQAVLQGGVVSIACTVVSVNEFQSGGYTLQLPLPVTPTRLGMAQMDPTTRCPNGRTVAVNALDGSSWTQVMTAVRCPVASTGATTRTVGMAAAGTGGRQDHG